MKKLWAIAVAAVAFAPVLVMGQPPADAQVRGKQIVDDAIAALGGQKFLNVQNRTESGRAYSFFQNQLSGLSVARFETRYVPVDPAKSDSVVGQQEYQGLGKEEAFYVVFREEGGWEVTYRGPTKLEKDQIERHHESVLHNVFYIMRYRLNEPGMVFEFQRSDVVDNMPVNIVDFIDSKNRVVTVYFHPTTKLPVRQSWVWREADTRERNEEVTQFSRYREVEGTQWPFQVHRERNGQKTYEMFADTVQINQTIDDARFAIPTAESRPFKPEKKSKKR
ncbi:MAG: hypothetical protein WDO18_18765 [Acidobacteriota bacterium]